MREVQDLETRAVESRRDKTSGVAERWRETRWRETNVGCYLKRKSIESNAIGLTCMLEIYLDVTSFTLHAHDLIWQMRGKETRAQQGEDSGRGVVEVEYTWFLS